MDKGVFDMLKDNKDKRILLRIFEKDFEYLVIVVYMVGMIVLKYIRMFCDVFINVFKIFEVKGELKVEDFKVFFNDKL